MKTFLTTLVLILIGFTATSQVQYLMLENKELNEVQILEDNQMVRVVTSTGKRHKGKMQIVDQNTISIKGELILLTEIDKIKKHDRLVAIILGAVVIYFSVSAVAIGLVIASWSGELAAGIAVGALGIAGTYGAINGINLSRSYKSYKGWTYRVEAVEPVSIAQ